MTARFFICNLLVLTCLISHSSFAAETVPAAPPPPVSAPAINSQEDNTVELRARIQQKQSDIYKYAVSLPESKREVYVNIVYGFGFVAHKLKLGIVKPEDVEKEIVALDKLYEDDGKLSEKEAAKWYDSFKKIASLSKQ